MARLVFSLWILASIFFTSLAAAFPSGTTTISAQRTFISQAVTKRITSFKQVKNPKWTSQQISTTEVYAAPFLKYHIPMPEKLATAFQNPPSARDVGRMSALERRVNGQTVVGSSGQ